jgi:hypothetical protein
MTAATKSLMKAVIYADRCVGFLIARAVGIEAFTAAEKSLGMFDSESKAVAAIFKSGAPT